MKFKTTIFLLCLVCLATSALADVEIKFSSINASKMTIMSQNIVAKEEENRFHALFTEDKIAIKTDKENLVFDLVNKKILWEKAGPDNTVEFEEHKFSTLMSTGINSCPFLNSAHIFYEQNIPKLKNNKLFIDNLSLNKWSWKAKNNLKIWDAYLWSLSGEKEKLLEIKNGLKIVINQCDALPNTGDIDQWCRALLSLDEIPLVVYSALSEETKMTKNSQVLLVVKSIDGQPYFTLNQARSFVQDRKSTAEKIIDTINKKISWSSLLLTLFPIVVILIVTVNFWGPLVAAKISGLKENSMKNKEKTREEITAFYNFFNFLKVKENITEKDLTVKKKILQRFIRQDEYKSLKSFFSANELKQIENILKKFSIEKKEIYIKSIKTIVKKLDKILENLDY